MREEAPHIPVAAVLEGLEAPRGAPAQRPTNMPPPAVDPDQQPDPGPELLLQTLRGKRWNKTETAAELHIPRAKVYRLMEKYGNKRPD